MNNYRDRALRSSVNHGCICESFIFMNFYFHEFGEKEKPMKMNSGETGCLKCTNLFIHILSSVSLFRN